MMATTPKRGLTLLELAIVMVVLAVLASLALPSMAARLRAERLQSAAEMFAADIADARHEAARRGSALHVVAQTAAGPGPAWCWSVATRATCSCASAGAAEATPAPAAAQAAQTNACTLKTVPAREHPGVTLAQSQPVRLEPDGQAGAVLAAVFTSGERQLQVQVSRFGRTRVCDPLGNSTRLPRC